MASFPRFWGLDRNLGDSRIRLAEDGALKRVRCVCRPAKVSRAVVRSIAAIVRAGLSSKSAGSGMYIPPFVLGTMGHPGVVTLHPLLNVKALGCESVLDAFSDRMRRPDIGWMVACVQKRLLGAAALAGFGQPMYMPAASPKRKERCF